MLLSKKCTRMIFLQYFSNQYIKKLIIGGILAYIAFTGKAIPHFSIRLKLLKFSADFISFVNLKESFGIIPILNLPFNI